MSSFLSTNTPNSFSPRAALHPFSAQPICAWDCSNLSAAPCTWPCRTSCGSHRLNSQACQASSLPSTPHSLVSLANLLILSLCQRNLPTFLMFFFQANRSKWLRERSNTSEPGHGKQQNYQDQRLLRREKGLGTTMSLFCAN